jgi:hypothetical protein
MMCWQKLIHYFGYHKMKLTLPERDGMIHPTLACWCGLRCDLPDNLYDKYFGKEH